MDAEMMQRLIDSPDDPKAMVAVAKGYLDGAVLRDPVAAEAWLMRAIEADHPVQSPRAMGLLARRILGRERVLSDGDVKDIRTRLCTAGGKERKELESLLALATSEQKYYPDNT